MKKVFGRVRLPIAIAAALLMLAELGAAPSGAADGRDEAIPPAGFAIDRQRAPLDRPARPPGRRYQGPIIDTHAHVFERRNGLDIPQVLAEMEEAGVRRLIVMPTPNEGRYDERDANAEARRRFVRIGGARAGRLCGSTYFSAWMHGAWRNGYQPAALAERLARLKQDLETGGCLGIGEIGPYHFEKRAGQWVLELPMTFEPMVRLARLAAREGVWMDVHAEPVTPEGSSYEDRVFGGVAHLFRAAPGLRLILSHTAMTNPRNARALLERYPGLMMNLKIVYPNRGLAWNNLGPIVNEDGALFEDWAALMEAMPDRFMIGIDARFGSKRYGAGKYVRRVRGIRALLGSLDEAAAEAIAWRNAERLWPAGQWRPGAAGAMVPVERRVR